MNNRFQIQCGISALNFINLGWPGQMKPLQLRRKLGKQRQRLNDQLIDAAGSLAAAHYKQCRAIWIKAESGTRSAGVTGMEWLSNGRAGDNDFLILQVRSRARETNE